MPAKKKVAPPPEKAGKAVAKKETNPLFEKRPRSFGIGQNLPPKKDLHRFVKWPKYVRLQRQKRILYKRLKVPPAIAQFSATVDKNTATSIFKLFKKYQPETKSEKKERLMDRAKAEAEGGETDSKKPIMIKYGLNHITYLVEQGKASLVVIAHDVDPIELVMWLPALCKKMGVPYCIIKGKSRLGQLVHQKTATALALTGVSKEDQGTLSKIVEKVKAEFNDNDRAAKTWGGNIMGAKSQAKTRARERVLAREMAQRMSAQS
mmetsp:Transcript_4406/g.15791  ORF Transcript_4406/g.15791 Transcript_4406/m.15791 type:complete len:263 (+) Transcript_4406:77-865(+)